jgi:hypothetical protein
MEHAAALQVLGTEDFYNYLEKYGLELDPQLERLVGRLYIALDDIATSHGHYFGW